MRQVARLVAQRVKTRLAYRGDVLAGLLSATLLSVVGPVFLVTLFANVPHLHGWTGPEVLFVWGFADTVAGLFYVVFAGLYDLNRRYILGGELDRLLVRPVDAYTQLLIDNLAFEELPVVLLGALIMAMATRWGLVLPEPWRLLLLPVWLVGSLATLGGIVTAVSSLGFHLHHRGTAVGLVLQLATLTRYPLDLFGRPLQLVLTFVLPMGFAGFYGAAFFLPREDFRLVGGLVPVVGAVSLAAGYGAFRVGLRRYTSAG
jgi:ABC-2 type transport system permease protein